jgi:predicted O-methyltransferase YrrM
MSSSIKTIVTIVATMIVTSGVIYSIWSGTENTGLAYKARLQFELFEDSFADRIITAGDIEKGYPYKNTYEFGDDTDWFTNKIAAWKVLLEPFKGKPNIRYLEVGMYEGRSVVWMFENILTHPTAFMTGIDIFYSFDGAYSPDLDARFRKNLEIAGGTAKSEIMVGFSDKMLRQLDSSKLYDIIYIDGGHDAPTVLDDAILSGALLKEGGIMIFDDYRHGLRQGMASPPLMRPKLAIDTFIKFYGDKYEIMQLDRQAILRKKVSS